LPPLPAVYALLLAIRNPQPKSIGDRFSSYKISTMAFERIYDGKAASGLSFEAYLSRAEERAAASTADDPNHDYRRLNVQRMHRVVKTFRPLPATIEAMQRITSPQLWMVITEDWCGDSAQSLPVLAAIAACSPHVVFSIVDRDENLHVMDRYLTNGARAIPKLVVFGSDGNERWTWGARPQTAQGIMAQQRAAGRELQAIYAEMHAWYAKDGGRTVEEEICGAVCSVVGVDR